jgi:hypothetical protein
VRELWRDNELPEVAIERGHAVNISTLLAPLSASELEPIAEGFQGTQTATRLHTIRSLPPLAQKVIQRQAEQRYRGRKRWREYKREQNRRQRWQYQNYQQAIRTVLAVCEWRISLEQPVIDE